MVCFPNAKINLGLNITGKLPDGYHTIESVFYPIPWSDVLEVIENKNFVTGQPKFNFIESGLPTHVTIEKNLCYKAYSILDNAYNLPAVNVWLHKIIPMGAGLGGGSADAAFMLKALNKLFKLCCTNDALTNYASTLGADCAFFIYNQPAFAQNKGELLTPVLLSLKGNYIVLFKPAVHISTADAYKMVTPQVPPKSLQQIITGPSLNWNGELNNDFEKYIFPAYPIIEQVKNVMYKNKAWYAAMSGSGSAVYGLFKIKPDMDKLARELCSSSDADINYVHANSFVHQL